ncbi:MAG: ubiquinone biosynthesis protein UbiB [Sphingomonadaceae bacterium]|nr:ubiquinone biosynthesis protein UbiB [Sphingomonadaceae bacterium]
MTAAIVHVGRLLRWGRTLGAHGALRGIEASPAAPPGLRRLAWLARLGTFAPKVPDYAGALEKLGPAAVKLGQALATRPDFIGMAAAADLARLQDALPPVPFARIEPALDATFGAPWQSLFASIDPQAVGAASIAQVHRGVTSDGRTVAVKVLRPDIEGDFARAIDTYEWAAARLERQGGEFARLRPRAVIALFKAWTLAELDLRREAASASELKAALVAEPDFVVPAVDWARTGRRVLTIDWIDGVKLSDRAAIDALPLDRRALAATMVRSFLRQAIAEGFFHADLHQGNLFVVPGEGGRAKIGVIDFGIMGRLDRRARVYLAEILYGLLVGNYRRVAEIHFEAGYVPAHHDIGEFATALRAVGEPIRGLAARDISIANLLDGLFAITRSFDMAVQPHLLLLQKTMVMVEGVALTLDPDVNMWEVAEPFVKEWIAGELGPLSRGADALVLGARALSALPRVFRQLIAKVPVEGAAPPGLPLPELTEEKEVKVRARVPVGWTALPLVGLGAALGWAAAVWL